MSITASLLLLRLINSFDDETVIDIITVSLSKRLISLSSKWVNHNLIAKHVNYNLIMKPVNHSLIMKPVNLSLIMKPVNLSLNMKPVNLPYETCQLIYS